VFPVADWLWKFQNLISTWAFREPNEKIKVKRQNLFMIKRVK
jgi:hypothetical protein